MKSIRTAFIVLCVINVLAVVGVLGWLGGTGRVDRRRMVELNDLFSPTTAQRDIDEQADADETLRIEAEILATALPKSPPIGSGDMIALRLQTTELDRQRLERLAREVADLQASLRRERALIATEQQSLEVRLAEFQSMRAGLVELEGADQFRKALGVLNGLKAEDAKAVLSELLNNGELLQVVSYISEMGERQRIKLIAEFISDKETPLAAELLEALRTRGLAASGPEVSSG